MNRELLWKKKKLLRRISEETYQDLLNYIGKIYLADYNVKILMARKFSNLFFALLPFAIQEEGNRRKHIYAKKFTETFPVIISNRALPMLKAKIQEGNCKRILLADDIIIHGRTLEQMYELIESWFKEANIKDYEIKVYAYAESNDGFLKKMKFADTREVCHKCSTGEWRAISNMIVDIFYLLGVSYTSYVPNITINKTSKLAKKITEKVELDKSVFSPQISADMKRNHVKGYVYIEEESRVPNFAVSCSIRLYDYDDLGEYVLVPMVMLNPIKSDNLDKCLESINQFINGQLWNSLTRVAEDDIRYRLLVYVVSALFGWKFAMDVLDVPASEIVYEQQEEVTNFSHVVLKKSNEVNNFQETVNRKWDGLKEIFTPIKDLDKITKDEKDFNELAGIFITNINEFVKSKQSYEGENSKKLVGKFLYLNGQLDEQKCKDTKDNKEQNSIDDSKRLIGFPVYRFSNIMGDIKQDFIKAILYAIDFGKGSIVSKKLEKNNAIYFLSVIHAGEQNYKYYENEYFPFLYGLYYLEHIAAKKKRIKDLPEWKGTFIKEYKNYWISGGRFYLNDDLDRLGEMNVTNDFGDVILNTDWRQLSDSDVIMARQMIKNITGGH